MFMLCLALSDVLKNNIKINGTINTTGPLVRKPKARLIVKKYNHFIAPFLR